MPWEVHNDANGLRNILVTLSQYTSVDIHWEADVAASNATGDDIGEWEVELQNGPRRVRVRHAEITNALWYANEKMTSVESAAYEARDAARQAALAKLTPDEKRLLRLGSEAA